jgi:hypothetical protein
VAASSDKQLVISFVVVAPKHVVYLHSCFTVHTTDSSPKKSPKKPVIAGVTLQNVRQQ